jgi:antitoxin ParD1/3/4
LIFFVASDIVLYMNVLLTPELDNFVAEKVQSGLYASASEVIGEALRLLKEREELRRVRLNELKREIAIGVRQLEDGQGIIFESAADLIDQVKAEGRRRSAAALG